MPLAFSLRAIGWDYSPHGGAEPATKARAMTWEAVSALAAVFTGLIIAATVIVGVRQLRLTQETLEHLRRATQLEGAMKIYADLNSPEFRESQLFVLNDLAR